MTVENLINCGFVKFAPADRPFPGRTGRPLHLLVDTRGAGAVVTLRNTIVARLVTLAVAMPPAECIVGLANAGTPWAVLLADRLGKPYASLLLKGARASGLRRELEGDIAGSTCLLIDNIIDSGDSLMAGIAKARAVGIMPMGAIAIVRKPKSSQAHFGIPVHSIWSTTELVQAARDLRLIGPDLLNLIKDTQDA